MGVTPPPPCVLRTALFWPCVLRTAKKIELNFYLTLYVTCVVFLHSGPSPLSRKPSISIRVYKTVVIPKALYESELWSSMTPADLGKLEHSHRFCLKHMQDLPRRTSTNFTLSAINAVPMATVIDHKKLNFLGQLCNLPCSALILSLILTDY